MSSDLEEVFTCIHNAQIPPLWEKVMGQIIYHSCMNSVTSTDKIILSLLAGYVGGLKSIMIIKWSHTLFKTHFAK